METRLTIEQTDGFKNIRVSDNQGNAARFATDISILRAGVTGQKSSLVEGSITCANGAELQLGKDGLTMRASPTEPTLHAPEVKLPKAGSDTPPSPYETALVQAAKDRGMWRNTLSTGELLVRGQTSVSIGNLESPVARACDGLPDMIRKGVPSR